MLRLHAHTHTHTSNNAMLDRTISCCENQSSHMGDYFNDEINDTQDFPDIHSTSPGSLEKELYPVQTKAW